MISRKISLPIKLLAAFAMLAAMLMGATSSASADDHWEYICHAAGNSGKYVKVPAADSGVANGHYGQSHQGARDIIPPFVYEGKDISQNWDDAGQAIYDADCGEPPTITLLTPGALVVVQATCVDPASLTLPVTAGITYTQNVAAAAGVVVTVTATIDDPDLTKFAADVSPWTRVSDFVATASVTFTTPDCPSPTATNTPSPTPTNTPSPTVTPVTPGVTPTETPVTPGVTPTEPPTEAPKVTPAPAAPVTALPSTGKGTSQADQMMLAVAGIAALALIAVGIRKRTEA